MEENKPNTQPTQEEQLEENPFKEGVEDYVMAIMELVRENHSLRKTVQYDNEIIDMLKSMIETYREKDEISQQLIRNLEKELAELKNAHEQD